MERKLFENLSIPLEVVLSVEISKNTVPIDTGSCRNLKKPEVLVEWKAPAIFRKIPNDDVMSDISLSISNLYVLCRLH